MSIELSRVRKNLRRLEVPLPLEGEDGGEPIMETLVIKYIPVTEETLDLWDEMAKVEPLKAEQEQMTPAEGETVKPTDGAAQEKVERWRLSRQLATVIRDVGMTVGGVPVEPTADFLRTLDLSLLNDINRGIYAATFGSKKT